GDGRAGSRLGAGWGGGAGDGVHAARHRAAPRRQHLRARLPRGAGVPAIHHADLRAGEARGGSLLSALRPAGAAMSWRSLWRRPNAIVGGSLLLVIIAAAV